MLLLLLIHSKLVLEHLLLLCRLLLVLLMSHHDHLRLENFMLCIRLCVVCGLSAATAIDDHDAPLKLLLIIAIGCFRV